MADFPKYKFHKELDPVVVHDKDQESKLGGGWEDSPADHGVITNPNAAETFEMNKKAYDDSQKSKGGRPKKNQDEE